MTAPFKPTMEGVADVGLASEAAARETRTVAESPAHAGKGRLSNEALTAGSWEERVWVELAAQTNNQRRGSWSPKLNQ